MKREVIILLIESGCATDFMSDKTDTVNDVASNLKSK